MRLTIGPEFPNVPPKGEPWRRISAAAPVLVSRLAWLVVFQLCSATWGPCVPHSLAPG